MEQLRFLFAIVLAFVVFFLWEYFFVDKEAIQKSKENLNNAQITKEEPYLSDFKGNLPNENLPVEDDSPEPLIDYRQLTINTPLYLATISEKGGVFKSLILKNYRESVDKNSALKALIPEDIISGTIQTEFSGNNFPDLKNAVFRTNIQSDSVNISDKPEEILFSWVSPQGIIFEKRLLFSPSTYLIGLKLTIKNGSNQTFEDNLLLSLINTPPEDSSRYGFEGPSALIDGNLEQVKLKSIEDKNIYKGELKWIAIEDRYFMSSIVPIEPTQASMHLELKNNGKILENQFLLPTFEIKPNTQKSYDFNIFFGPKSMKILNSIDYDLKKAINFGMFDIIAKPCLWFMNFLYGIIPNYGIAIIILTIFTKIILWPLGSKSYKSMSEMKKLQPLMAEIREKYKNDKKQMNQEIMGLYKIYKVNPMGGCLPMIFQIPVFFALYRMLYEAIELRHAPFFGWINDLSAPDRLFHFNFTVPLMEPPYGIPVLTIIMGATMFLQQKMSPAPGDPGQAKFMMLMPVFFTFIFINFSSGLVLYWLVNNILSISQQYYIQKKTA
ncbi:MAG: membrane protein insertase YidC [Desulfobacterales bacterium]|nr:membrane protein insertase YidC [Desulfobacterales bacterium]